MTTPLRIELDRTSPVPLYHQVAAGIETAITEGRLRAGVLLENEVALAGRLGISRPTARQALGSLVDRGLLVRRRGVGTQVAPERVRRPAGLTSLNEDLAASGRRPDTRILEYCPTEATPEMSRELEVDAGTSVVVVRRLCLADAEPIAVMTNLLRREIAPAEAELAERGLYASLRSRGVQPALARQRIGARLATESEARMLQEPGRTPLLTIDRIAFDDTGAVIEVGHHYYRASRYDYETTLFAR
ncbi:GntR family transcriptional regulator [Propioniciclava soli]|uniref:GntR family transcriptional regulator n=1 Tax=Propioniciclava soli TaxID=2775081 RepID=UPI001E591F25